MEAIYTVRKVLTIIKLEKITLILFINVLVFTGCEKSNTCDDDDLHFDKISIVNSPIKIGGYYFGDVNAESTLSFANIYYFYQNGVFFTSEATDLDKAEFGNIPVDVPNEFGMTIKGVWGVYRINGNEIEISRWQSSQNGCEVAILERGEILNDSTFVLEPRVGLDNRFFRFRPLDQKPDSTNNFID